MNRRGTWAALVAASVAVSGCVWGGAYSNSRFGPGQGDFVTLPAEGKSVVDVLTSFGAPQFTTDTPEGGKAWVYRITTGLSVVWVFGQVKKQDLVVLFDAEGKVSNSVVVPSGNALSVLSGVPAPAFDAE